MQYIAIPTTVRYDLRLFSSSIMGKIFGICARLEAYFAPSPAMTASKAESQPSQEQVVMDEVKGHVQIITLNNPSKLNIISREVVSRLADLYEKWEKENDAEIMIIKGAGRAFCAGGNLRALYYGKAGKHTIELFDKTYWLQYHIHTYKKTLVAFVNGLAMGAGASLAMPSTFRVVTEKTKLEELERRLVDLNTGDRNIIRAAIEEFSLQVNLGEKSILHNGFLIDKCFSNDTVEEIIESLAAASDMEGNEWVEDTIDKLKRSSPISLKMTLRSVRQARKQTLFECLKKEFRFTINTLRGLISNDTYEGIRALIIEKDNSPKWNPPSLSDVTEDRLNLLFQPLDEEFELQLPTEGKLSRWEGKYENSDFHVKYPRNYDYGVGMHKVMFHRKSQL